MSTFMFNFLLNVVEFIKYAFIPVFNSLYQSIFLLQMIVNTYLIEEISYNALPDLDGSYNFAAFLVP